MRSRMGVVAVMAVVALLSGCGGSPDPVASTPAFATEDEAFAAAEQTYRNYVDALNRVDLSDPATFEDVYRWTTGESYANERKSLSRMHADGWSVSGGTVVTAFKGISFTIDDTSRIVAHVCTDVHEIEVFDANGVEQSGVDRSNEYTLEVNFNAPSNESDVLIASSIAISSNSCTL